ncbi:hypothetical protein TNIN_204841 [Trichonephila inaurata madagascariensis]|uniref:Uncharacterized protein n=1 Tax=Trichonephila inaurata madagascariensis TaxID=2747483 RepID=A0A8X7CBL8_9ARAC|nr:hypothetical protein TNIN_204841 [Trichonephila inaurata madagascariensis]
MSVERMQVFFETVTSGRKVNLRRATPTNVLYIYPSFNFMFARMKFKQTTNQKPCFDYKYRIATRRRKEDTNKMEFNSGIFIFLKKRKAKEPWALG